MSGIWLVVLFGTLVRGSVGTDLKALDDGVLFAVKWPGLFTEDVLGEMEPGAELMEMSSADGENYKCVIPPLNPPTEAERHEYTGPNALELLEPLIQQTSCSFRLESYWTYEVCHGKYVRQYHQETGRAPKLQEYYLGKWEGDRFKTEVAKLTELTQEKKVGPLPTKKIDGMNMPYVEMNMTDGTVCDLSGTPRSVRVLYICYRQGKHEIYSLEETRTCEYEVIVLSPLLCAHPDYRVRDQLHNDISCYAEDALNRRPKTLKDMEAESLKLRHQTTILELTTGPGKRYTVEINPVDIQEVLDQADRESQLDSTREAKPVPKPEMPPSYDAKLVEEFLAGTYCLHGGTGWWKYEFCYGKKVVQYHVDPDGSKTTVLLGQFDKDAHMEWLMKNPKKKPLPGVKKTISHFYSGGSMCDITTAPRHVEVKLKCREPSGASESANAVSLYLLEPEVCSYILGVESPILCHILDTADEFGMMTLPTAAIGTATITAAVVTPTLDSDVEEETAGIRVKDVPEDDFDEDVHENSPGELLTVKEPPALEEKESEEEPAKP